MTNLAVTRLKLSNFRNYESLDLQVSSDSAVIIGANGSGKTNILEAISLLTAGRGIRSAKLSVIDRIGEVGDSLENRIMANMPWSIFAEIENENGSFTIGTGRDSMSQRDKRIVKIDGELKRSQSELSHYFSVISLTPQMDQTFADGVTSRRSFLDRLAGVFFPDHIKHLSIYSYAKSERQKLLAMTNPDPAWLTSIESRMAEQGVAIAHARLEVIDHLRLAVDMQDSKSLFPRAIMCVKGDVEASLESMPALQAEEKFGASLKATRQIDCDSGRTSIGVHKSDFIVTHSGKKMPAEICSTGEQKALLLSIIIAAAKARKSWFGSSPVVILDEVVAHLDEAKRRELSHELSSLNAQYWLTGTDREFFRDFKANSQFLTIENSKILV